MSRGRKHIFEVTLERTVRFHATVEVSARDRADAEVRAKEEADRPRANYWREDTVEDEKTISVREVAP